MTKQEYEDKLAELERRRYGETTGGGGLSLFPRDSIWTGLDLPPEKFNLYASMTGIGIGTFFLIMTYVYYLNLDNPILRGGRGEGVVVPWVLVITGVLCVVCFIPMLME